MAENSVSNVPVTFSESLVGRLETTTIVLDDDDEDSTPSYEMPKLVAVWSLADADKELQITKVNGNKTKPNKKRKKKKKLNSKAARRAERECYKRKREQEEEYLRRERQQALERKMAKREARRASKQQRITNQKTNSSLNKQTHSNSEPIVIEDDEPSPKYIRTVNINKLLANTDDVPQSKMPIEPGQVTSSDVMQTPLLERNMFVINNNYSKESYAAVPVAPGIVQIVGTIANGDLNLIGLDNVINSDINANSATGMSVFALNDTDIRIVNRFSPDDNEVIISDDLKNFENRNNGNIFQNCMINMQSDTGQNSLNSITIPMLIGNNIKKVTIPDDTKCIQNSTNTTAVPVLTNSLQNTDRIQFSANGFTILNQPLQSMNAVGSSNNITKITSPDVVTIDDDEAPPIRAVKTLVSGRYGTVELMKISGEGGHRSQGAVDWEEEIPMDLISVVN